MWALVLALLIVFAVSVPARAEQACTQAGCENGVVFNIDPARKWPAGNYLIYATLDLKTIACKGELPLKPCGEGPSFICSAPGVTIGESGCALPEEAQGIARIKLEGEPKRVIIRITHEGKPVVTKTFYPEYQMSQPNGPSCGPVCKSAAFDLFTRD